MKDLIVGLFAAGHTAKQIAKEVGVDRSTLYKILKRNGVSIDEVRRKAGIPSRQPTVKNSPPGVISPLKATLDASTITGLRKRLEQETDMRKQLAAEFLAYKAANDLLSTLDINFTSPTVITPRATRKDSETLAVFCNSDWHAYEIVKSGEVNGLNSYNPVICRDSVETSTRFFVKQTQACRGNTKVTQAMVCYLGDLITGHLHLDQVENNYGTPLEEVMFVIDLIVGQLSYILKHGKFEEITVVTVDGNHSRLTEKPRKTNRVHHSLEWLIFQFVKRHFEKLGETRLKFSISTGIHNYVALNYGVNKRTPNGLLWRLTHGDVGISYRGGVGGISIPVNRQIRVWDEGQKADLTIFGHLHTAEANLKRYLAVGSLIGVTPNGLRFGYEPPTQAMLTVEKTKGITGYYPIFVR